jgi:hypothetical protein
MQGIGIKFGWFRYSDYRLEVERPDHALTAGSLFADARAEILVAKGSALKTTPIDSFPDLYLQLAKASPAAPGHLEFARKYGLLTDTQKDYVDEWPRLVNNMKQLIETVADTSRWEVQDGRFVPYDLPVRYSLRLEPRGDSNQMALSVVPNTLYQAIVLQCVSSRIAGAEIRSCKACGALFQVGGSSGHNLKRQFCSDPCRFEFSHRKRRPGGSAGGPQSE